MVLDRPSFEVGTLVGLAFSFAMGCSSSSSPTDTPGDASDAARGDASDARVPFDSAIEAGVPHLTELEVSSTTPTDGSPSISLVPAFSPTVYDYYVRCAAGTNALQVSMKASPGARSLLTQPVPSASLAMQTIAVSVSENQAIVAAASDGAATVEYWVRCLPHDFPRIEMDLHPEAGAPPPGYYLVGNRQLVGAQGGYAMVVDVRGVPVWYIKQLPGAAVRDVDDIVPGSISFAPSPGSSASVPFEVRALSPPATTYLGPSSPAVLDFHELQPLPNGDYLVFSEPTVTGQNLTGLTTTLPDGGTLALGSSVNILACNIVEFEPTSGKIVWQWTALDHIDPAQESTVPEYDGPNLVDVFHCNSIDVDHVTGNLLASFRNMDAVFYIDRVTSKILWKMGGQPYSKDNATLVPVDSPFFRQHDARIQSWSETCAGGSGQISLFDDESMEPGPARGAVYDLVVSANGPGDAGVTDATASDCAAPDGATTQGTLFWQATGLSSSGAEGSFRISSDGSRVICWGDLLTPNLVFTEVDVDGHDLADFYFLDGDTSYRTIKVPLSALNLGVLRNTAGLP
jgi:hypothetical protein